VLVERRDRAPLKTWAWEIRRTPGQLTVQLQKDGFSTAKAAKRAGEKALHTLLESLSGEKLNAEARKGGLHLRHGLFKLADRS
jgi:hypothetical protein